MRGNVPNLDFGLVVTLDQLRGKVLHAQSSCERVSDGRQVGTKCVGLSGQLPKRIRTIFSSLLFHEKCFGASWLTRRVTRVGLQLDPKEKYKQSVEVAFKVTMAAIDAGSKDKARAVVKVKVDDDTYVLCTLVAGSVWQQPLDILFSEGDEIEFFAEGAKVHLTGYFVDMGGDDDDDMSDEEDGMSGEEGDSGSDVDDEDIPPELLAKLRKQAELEGSDDSEEEAVIMKALGDKKRKNDAPPKEDTKKAKPEVKKEDTKKLQLKGGVVATDITVGKGPEAVKGKKVGMRYVGKLYVNGKPTKQFDANTNGKPFAFKLGVGEVIQGWDVGVQGMKVGGERELVIPAAMGYGKRGAPPDIPPNATLHFSVKLVDVRK